MEKVQEKQKERDHQECESLEMEAMQWMMIYVDGVGVCGDGFQFWNKCKEAK